MSAIACPDAPTLACLSTGAAARTRLDVMTNGATAAVAASCCRNCRREGVSGKRIRRAYPISRARSPGWSVLPQGHQRIHARGPARREKRRDERGGHEDEHGAERDRRIGRRRVEQQRLHRTRRDPCDRQTQRDADEDEAAGAAEDETDDARNASAEG